MSIKIKRRKQVLDGVTTVAAISDALYGYYSPREIGFVELRLRAEIIGFGRLCTGY